MNKSESIAALAKAMAAAQGEIENASKNTVNGHFKNRYADLAEVLNTIREPFSKRGLSFVQFPSFSDGVAHVETMLMHESGEWVSSIASAPVGKQDAQGVGSAVTYLRRYSAAAMAGIAQEDDDGNSSVGAPQKNTGNTAKQPASGSAMATSSDAFSAMSEDEQVFLRDTAMSIIGQHAEGNMTAIMLQYGKLDNDEKLAMWHLLPSNIRSDIKKDKSQ